MIDFHFWTTPNGYKVLLFLEETGLAYRVKPVNISKGEQFAESFLKIAPNNRIPAIVDHGTPVGEPSTALFESGAILLYLAEKTGRFIPVQEAGRSQVMQWLFWQMGGLGPMAGQNLHFTHYAPEQMPYAITRYQDETARLFRVMDRQLAGREYLAGELSIADLASFPWVHIHDRLQLDLDEYPHLRRWHDQIAARPATDRAYKIGAQINTVPTVTEASRKILLGQSVATLTA